MGQIRMRRLHGRRARSSLDSRPEPPWKRSSWTLYFHALCGQFGGRSAGRSRGTSMQFGSHPVERRHHNFRVTAGHDNHTELAPDDRGGTMKRPTRRSTSQDLDTQAV